MSTLSLIKESITRSTGWKRAAIPFCAGLLSVLALAPFFLTLILFFTLPPLVWLVEASAGQEISKAKLTRAFLDGWWFGFGYFFAGLFWVGEAFLVESEIFGWLLPFAVTLLPAGLALFYGITTSIACAIWKPGPAGLLRMAVLFSLADWLRGHILTGFPWNVLGYALTANEKFMQAAGLIGIYGLSLWAFVIFSSPLVLTEQNVSSETGWKRVRLGVLLGVVPLAVFFVYGSFKISEDPPPNSHNPRVRLVQPSIPQREKWIPEKQAAIFSLHLDLSQKAEPNVKSSLQDVTFLIWPEAAMPFRPLDHPEALDALKTLLNGTQTILISGGLRADNLGPHGQGSEIKNPPSFFNSILVFSNTGELLALYDKIHLVPFGEYLPFQKLLETLGLQQITKLRGGFTPGPRPRPLLKVSNLPSFAGLICYEAIFPGDVVQGTERPDFLVNVTNDGWFGETIGPYQHLHQTRVRAVEEGLPILRAANNGISAVIDASGRVQSSLGLNERGFIDALLPPQNAAPLYARWGDWTYVFNALLFVGLAFAL